MTCNNPHTSYVCINLDVLVAREIKNRSVGLSGDISTIVADMKKRRV